MMGMLHVFLLGTSTFCVFVLFIAQASLFTFSYDSTQVMGCVGRVVNLSLISPKLLELSSWDSQLQKKFNKNP
jgi:hypothetical protein